MKKEWSLVVASGPSLIRKDLDLLRTLHWRRVIAVNNSVIWTPWADVLFAGDGVWWRNYGPRFNWFKGECVSKTAKVPGIKRWTGKGWPRTGGNSGHMAIQYEVDDGGRNLAIIGFDQRVPEEGKNKGKVHFHGDHPKMTRDGQRTNMGNGTGIRAWPRLMRDTSVDLKNRGVRVINLSRETALDCFERMTAEKFAEMVNG